MSERRYNLAIIRQQQQLLLLQRIKPPYAQLFNGVGGKQEPNETQLEGMIREVYEETGLRHDQYQLTDLGWLDWHVDGQFKAAIDVYLAEVLPQVQLPPYPQQSREGLLALKPIEWALRDDNQQLVADLKAILPAVLMKQRCRFYTEFEGDQLVAYHSYPLTAKNNESMSDSQK